ncbi:Vacuolar ABC heavy metal transporter (H.t1.c1) [Penicillium paradoxum]|uniref:Vacuolar ABC heavy metal transporter (H.t1.c1) n=1 Tax=Penicillium paradoxum TaxID=176176 RepID=UPI002546C478|nr:Vacuolar ABC heavy metal transporter (H.t1.c1) [Penicillium paradoxum]KAJ5774292.1 Vacuolar ABC heavy metal transporter (H.t1.c1) [Penicillium paradoxum]
MDPHAALELLEYLRSGYPVFLLILFVVAFVANTTVTAKNASKHESQSLGPGGRPLPQRLRTVPAYHTPREFSRNVKHVFNWLSVAVLLTFIADATIYIVHVMLARSENWWRGQSFVIYVVGSFFVYAVLLMAMLDTSPSPTLAQFVCWSVAVPIEMVILSTSLSIYTSAHHEPIVGNPEGGRVRRSITFWECLEVGSNSIRILILFALVLLYVIQSLSMKSQEKASKRVNGATETTGLLDPAGAENGNGHAHANGNGNGNGTANGHSYGSTNGTARPQPSKPTDPWVRPTTIPSTSWWEYLSGYSLFFPYLWPSKSRRLQLVVTFCFGLLMCQRVVNVLVPYQIGLITGSLTKGQEEGGEFEVPWIQICLYVVYRWLQGNQGLLSSLRSSLWIPVSQYSYMELSTAAFEHVHGLSLDFHLGKKTGEVLSALSKGSSINTFLEQVTFQVVPMLVDLIIAIVYFLVAFDVYYALAVGISTFGYLYVTIRMAQWRAEIRRQMVNASRQEDAVKNDSMVSYETVKYFNAEQYEFNRYRGAVADFQKAEYHVLFSLTLLNTCQNTVFMLGLLVMCFICAYQVAIGQRPVGKFVSLLAYMVQLQGPLNFFGTFYRSIQSALINAERLLELFREQPTVIDSPRATPLAVCRGDIKFEDVEFAYDARKPALNGLTFHCEPGTTTALVGESGGGKSTVFRLLFRFYNAENGRICIDGQDVQDITIDSLRQNIGVVPQDTVLFNETLMYNLKYANQNASDEEVFEACRAASIHDKIMNFPDGYNTKVGERGLRLSGGEKQRVAIARTIIKNPRVILLDEATAALDTDTEEHIQRALSTLSKGRTMLVIAHRLSTITTADRILVLSEGQVAESGTHEELLAMKGRYASMWRKQIRAQKAAQEQERLRAATTSDDSSSRDDSSSQSDEDRKGVPCRAS